jgi:hypothetical protein
MNIKGFSLQMTCGACPEQYDVYLNDKKVAYFRLRYGNFTVDAPFGGVRVYESNTKGDGIFEYEERDIELGNAIDAVIQHYIDLGEIELVGCHDCKTERYTFTDDLLIKCHECSPHTNKFHYKKL